MQINSKHWFRLLITKLFVLISLIASSQVVADFSLSETEGCAPMHIVFTNNSVGSGLSYSWNFDNGNSSSLENPEANFGDAGQYNVTLTVSDGSASDEITKIVTVYANPVANFTPANYAGCVGDVVQFDDVSSSTAAIVDWIWDFKDGSYPAHVSTLTHTYSMPDLYGVSLEVVDVNGCRGFVEHLDIINIAASPTFTYTASPATACTIPTTVSFEASIQNSSYTYEWDLGSGSFIGTSVASTTYNDYGYYDCSLKVTNENNCSTTRSYPNVNISQVESVFYLIANGDTMQAGDTVCPGQVVHFWDASSGGSFINWQNNGSAIGTGSHIWNTYTQSGIQTISHSVSGSGCSDSGTFSFYVDEIIADFGPDYDTLCTLYNSLQFNDASTNATSWMYVWGDGDTSFIPNPSHIFNFDYPVNDYEGHDVNYTLVVTSPFGCTDSHTESFYLNMPFAEFVSDIEEGGSPLSVEFINHSKPSDQITNYTWLHNGNVFSYASNPNYTFTDPGEQEIQLIVSNDEGCIDTSIVRIINIGEIVTGGNIGGLPVDLDSAISCNCSSGTCFPADGSPATFCASETLTLTIYDNNPVNMYQFDGLGLSHMCSNSNSGQFNITGVVGASEISGAIINYGVITQLPSIPVMISGPYVSFDYAYDCDSALKYNFTGLYLGDITSFEWDFGDGTTDAVNQNPIHQYDTSGNYTVQLTAYSSVTACSYQYSEVVVVRDLKADFFLEDELCVGAYLPEITQLEHEYSPINKPFMWFRDDVPTGYKDSTYALNIIEGLHEYKLVVRDTNFCTDTIVRAVTGLQPHAFFSADITSGCSPLSIEFTDTSDIQYGLLERYWVILGDTVSSDEIMTYVFNSVDDFSVQLIVYDSLQCSDALTKIDYITVANPIATITASDNTICSGTQVDFSTNYSAADSAVWYIDTVQINTSNNNNVSYQFNEAGIYNVSLVIWESNCSDSAFYSPQIRVQEAFADYSVSDTISDCYPSDITFDFLGGHPEDVVSWQWDFGDDGLPAGLPDTVRYNYGSPGVYSTSLSTTTSFGCQSSQTLEITINGPLGDLLIDPGIICYGESVDFKVINLQDVEHFELDYGDGNRGFDLISTHTYQNEFSGAIHPSLILFSDSVCKIYISEDLVVHRVVADFIVNDQILDKDTLIACHPFDAYIENTSVNANAYQWSLSNGQVFNETDVYQLFENTSPTTEQIYTINLHAVYTPYNCSVDTSVQIRVLPIPNVDLASDTAICQGDTIQLFVNGNTNAILSWDPIFLNNDENIWAPQVSPEEQSFYVATVNLNNCINSDTIEIKVQDGLSVEWSMDTTVIIGQSATIYAVPDQANCWPHWTPNYELSCDTCIQVVATPLETTTYTFEISDSLGCRTYIEEILIEVDEQYSVNLPSSFTPNDDGVNDVIYVRGWGIEELLEFRIFNRWGEEIFFTNDIYQGWDGTFRGTVQNIDSYAYMVKVKMYSGQEISKTGNITLLR